MVGIFAIKSPYYKKLIFEICSNFKFNCSNYRDYYLDDEVALLNIEYDVDGNYFVNAPYSNEEKNIFIVYEGRIYNKNQVIEKIKTKNIGEYKNDDKILLHCYMDNGYEFLKYLNGMFVFCLWDSVKNRLFCARDRLGLKSLYFYDFQDILLISSEIKNILSIPIVPRKTNDKLVYEYLVSGARATRDYVRKTQDTFFSGIKEVLPSNYMAVNDGGITLSKYWCPKDQSVKNIKNSSFSVNEFRDLLEDSIKIRMPKDESLGLFLSGGLDSTSLTLLTKTLSERDYKDIKQEIFSAIYRGEVEQGEEIDYIKEVEASLKNDINYIYPRVEDNWSDIRSFVYFIEEPVGVFNYYVYWYLFREAREKVSVVFHGQGPDEILGGHTGHLLTYLKYLWKNKNLFRLIKETIYSSWAIPYILRSIWFKRNAKIKAENLLSIKFVEKYRTETNSSNNKSLTEALYSDTTGLLVEHLRVEDRASSALSVECRHPFLDHRLVELAFSLPEDLKIRNGYTKYILRRSMEGIIPEVIRKKKKKSATPIPFKKWIKELKPYIIDLFESKRFIDAGYFNKEKILEVFNLYCDGRLSKVEYLYYPGLIWRLINLGLWLEAYEMEN